MWWNYKVYLPPIDASNILPTLLCLLLLFYDPDPDVEEDVDVDVDVDVVKLSPILYYDRL